MDIPNGSKSFAALNPHLFIQPARATVKAGEVVPERKLHDQIEDYCRARGWFYVHSRMDRASTIAVGFPDFGIFIHGARTVFLECKRPGEKATIKQLEKIAHARKLGFVAEIVESMDGALEAIGRAQTDNGRAGSPLPAGTGAHGVTRPTHDH